MSHGDENLRRLMRAAAGSETMQAVLERGRLVVGTKVDYDGVGFLRQDGSNAGVEVELSRFIACELLGDPRNVEFVPVVFANRTEYLLRRRIDLIVATVVMTPERAEVIDASIPYLRAGGGTLLARNGGPVTSWETCRGRVIAGLDRAYFNPLITERYGATVVEFEEAEAAYEALADGRCEAMAFDEILVRRKILSAGWSDYSVVGEPLQRHYHQVGMRKGNEPFLAVIDYILLQAQAQGRIVAWEREFGITDPWSEEQVAIAQRQLAALL